MTIIGLGPYKDITFNLLLKPHIEKIKVDTLY